MKAALAITVLTVTLAGCPGGDGAIGDSCSDHGSCASGLQCLHSVCQPRCERAPECGDGYRCDENGLCHAATGEPGDSCESEVDCGIGLSCQVSGVATRDDGLLAASCVAENAARPAGATCSDDQDCRNGTCDLGHCIDLCRDTIDCGAGTSCTQIPRVESLGLRYEGCLQSKGALTWSIPVNGTSETVQLPIPDTARGVSVMFSVEDRNQRVGATFISNPEGVTLLDSGDPALEYYANPYVRHRPDYGQSVLAMPSSPTAPLLPGIYNVKVRSLRDAGGISISGTAIPAMTAVLKLDAGNVLDLHFYFLDLTDHPCRSAFPAGLDATKAQEQGFFKGDTSGNPSFLSELRAVLAKGGIALGTGLTYTDLPDHHDLDGLDISNASSLFALGEYSSGINVFFVRSLSPVGLQALGPNPGPAGLAKTRQSGIVISVESLCYRSWPQLARITGRELARYLGLYSNTESDPLDPMTAHTDPIPDSDTSNTNLMHPSELAGSQLSDGQRYILTRSPALR